MATLDMIAINQYGPGKANDARVGLAAASAPLRGRSYLRRISAAVRAFAKPPGATSQPSIGPLAVAPGGGL